VISDDGPREDGDSPSSGREVAVDHEIEYARRLDLRIIDLDLVGLRESGRWHCRQADNDPQDSPHIHPTTFRQPYHQHAMGAPGDLDHQENKIPVR
jgi:hypothetical protein